jgi:hypothetical protein
MKIGCADEAKRRFAAPAFYPRRSIETCGWLRTPTGLDNRLQSLKFFARLEADGFSGRDANLLSRAGVAADSGLARLNIEDPKPSQLDPLAAPEGILHGFKDSFHCLLSPGPRNVSLLDDGVDDV